MSEDNELRDVVLQDYKEFKGRIEALEKKLDVWIEGQKKYNRATGETIAELKEKLDSPTLPDPYYPCGKEKDSGGEKVEFRSLEFVDERVLVEERVRGATRKELIEEFIVKLRKKHEEIQNSYEGIYPNLLLELIEEYEGMLKK